MFETPFAMAGTIVTDPIHRRVGDQQVIKFRVASNSRRRTPEGEWEQGNSLFVNVNCWGRLVDGAAALIKGDPVVVIGQVYTSEYVDSEQNRRSSIEVRATAVGPDLGRTTVRIDQRKRLETVAEPVAADPDDTTIDGDDETEDADAGEQGLPLTA